MKWLVLEVNRFVYILSFLLQTSSVLILLTVEVHSVFSFRARLCSEFEFFSDKVGQFICSRTAKVL